MSKIFGIGMPKTGTTSLAYVLRKLGYRHKGYTPEIISAISNKNYHAADAYFHNFDSFADLPWPLIYQYLHNRFPTAKFILTLRSPKTWIKSCVKHFGSSTRKPTPHIGEDARNLAFGAGWPVGYEELYLQKYEEHNTAVQNYFSNNLLTVCWENGDGWPELCKFLNLPIPQEPFPNEKPPFKSLGKDLFNQTKHLL